MGQINSMLSPVGGMALYGAWGGHKSPAAQMMGAQFNSYLSSPQYQSGQSLANSLGYQGSYGGAPGYSQPQRQLIPVQVNGHVQWMEV